MDRRTLLAGAAVVAFDRAGRRWLTRTGPAASSRRAVDPVPELDGTLTTEPPALAAAGDDFGHIVHDLPAAVLRPGSVRDVVAMVRYANRHRIAVAMRGQGHTTFGQAQVRGGVVIDSSTLATIHHIGRRSVTVDAGVVWHDLARATLPHGLTPPVFTDYIELSVGGTLCGAGIGGTTQRYGFQVDTALELEVVTGEGELRRCSASREPRLFEAVLGGLGQYAIIVRATLALVPAPTHARGYQLFYRDLDTYLGDQRRLLAGGRFSSLEGQVARTADDAGWEFFVDAAAYHDGARPADATLLRGLRFDPARTVITDYDYPDWLDRLAPVVAQLKQLGVWGLPHPWLDVFLPASRTRQVVSRVLQTLTLADTGQGPVLLYPFATARTRRPAVQVPREPVAFLFSLLRTAPGPDAVGPMLAGNRQVYEQARDAGGKRYPIGALHLDPADWRDHYGPRWPAVLAAKQRYDPRHVLTPGQHIFPGPA